MRLYHLLGCMAVDPQKYNPVRRIEGRREMWRSGPNGVCVNRIVKASLRDGLMSGHYPHNEGHASLTDKGLQWAKDAGSVETCRKLIDEGRL